MRDDPTRAATVLSYLAVRRFEGSSPFASTEKVLVRGAHPAGQGAGPGVNVAKNVATHRRDRRSQWTAVRSSRRRCRLEGRRDARSRLPSTAGRVSISCASRRGSDWRDVRLIDSVGESFERQLARRRERTGLGPCLGRTSSRTTPRRPSRSDSLSDGLVEARGNSTMTLQDVRHYVATPVSTQACRTGPSRTCSATAR
jgi:hypothetical protein